MFQMECSCEVDGVLVVFFWMEQGLVNWTEFCMKVRILDERGVAEGFFLGNFPGGARLGDLDGFLHGKSDQR